MRTYQLSWILYIVGSLLVFGSWVGLVPTGLGWLGWLAALAGWAMGNAGKQKKVAASKADEIAKLNLLRKEGIITDAEFEAEKKKLMIL